MKKYYDEICRAIDAVTNHDTRGVFFKIEGKSFVIVDKDTYFFMQGKDWDRKKTEVLKENIMLKRKIAGIKILVSNAGNQGKLPRKGTDE